MPLPRNQLSILRIVGRDTLGWPLVQTWFYLYGGNDGERCTRGIRVRSGQQLVALSAFGVEPPLLRHEMRTLLSAIFWRKNLHD